MRFGKGKIALLMSILATTANKMQTSIKDLKERDIDNAIRECRHARSGFTSNLNAKVRKRRIKSAMAKASRRRNRN